MVMIRLLVQNHKKVTDAAVRTCRLLSPTLLTSSSSLSSSSLGITDTQDRTDMSELSEAVRRPVDCHSSLSFSDS